jgi:Protein of unknown function (DUF3223)
MPYEIGYQIFETKDKIVQRCQEILYSTPNGNLVDENSFEFLINIFLHHDEWEEKSKGDVYGITTQMTSQGTTCFLLLKSDGSDIDISFRYAIKKIPSRKSAIQLPQNLIDFRDAARTSILHQKYEFRDQTIKHVHICEVTKIPLSLSNCVVDHKPPKTFDRLLFDFCKEKSLNPLKIEIGSLRGTIAIIQDETINVEWQEYHRANAELRLLSKLGNLKLPKVRVPWSELWE